MHDRFEMEEEAGLGTIAGKSGLPLCQADDNTVLHGGPYINFSRYNRDCIPTAVYML